MQINDYNSLRLTTIIRVGGERKQQRNLLNKSKMGWLASKFSGYHWMAGENSMLPLYYLPWL